MCRFEHVRKLRRMNKIIKFMCWIKNRIFSVDSPYLIPTQDILNLIPTQDILALVPKHFDSKDRPDIFLHWGVPLWIFDFPNKEKEETHIFSHPRTVLIPEHPQYSAIREYTTSGFLAFLNELWCADVDVNNSSIMEYQSIQDIISITTILNVPRNRIDHWFSAVYINNRRHK